MKLLLSCVNSLVSLVGYDTETRESFWYCPGNVLRACGICYHGSGLAIASDDYLTTLRPDGVSQFKITGTHPNLAHSVKELHGALAVADTGNSRIALTAPNGRILREYDPLQMWPDRPADAIHLNDFIPTETGLLASCFSYQPFQQLKQRPEIWKQGGHGLVLEMVLDNELTVSRVVASGLSCPHSLHARDDALYCCSSLNGSFVRMERAPGGTYATSHLWNITDDHFLRGALPHETGWFLGGSCIRTKAERSGMAVFHFDESTGAVDTMKVAPAGEIYDILPWDDAIMQPLMRVIDQIPASDWDENEYPPKPVLG